MSLVLRKECQEILDGFGLGHLHCTVNNNNKLSIVSECGKPFMTIQGIRFSRLIPTITEISYSVELLDAFMGLHGEDILNFIRAEKNFVIKKEPYNKKFKCIYNNTSVRYNPNLTAKDNFSTCEYIDQIFKVIINTKSKVEEIVYINSIKDFKSLTPIKTFQQNKKLRTEAKLFLKEYHSYKTEELNVSTLKSKLSVCDV